MFNITKSLIIILGFTLPSCGGGSDSQPEEKAPEIETYNTFYGPSNFTDPLIEVKVTFANNFSKEDLKKLTITAKVSADDTPDGQGNELALFYIPKISTENSRATHIKYTWSNQVGYGSEDRRYTYYHVSNESGQLVLTIKQFGYNLIVGSTQKLLEAGNFRLNVEAKYHSDTNLSSVISTDFLPAKDVYTSSGYNFTDNENDYLDHDASADIVAVDVSLDL